MKYFIPFIILIVSIMTGTGFCKEPLMPAMVHDGSMDRIAKNYTYNLFVAKRAVQLKNGFFKGGDNPENSINASLVQYKIADLNGDGDLDFVVIIEHHGMGSAGFYELSGLIKNNKQYVQTTPILLGDNIDIKNVTITSPDTGMPWMRQEILITMLAHKESDSHAKPTLEKTVCYYLENNELKDCQEMEVVKKPALYFYPVKKMSVEVVLDPEGKVIQSIPLYKKKWRVVVDKNGLIDRKYSYLFYEVALDKRITLPDNGWSVPYSGLNGWFDKYLYDFGLNKNEADAFKVYWLQNLPVSNYYTIKLIRTEIVNDQLGLKIFPKPDSLLRVLLSFAPTQDTVNLKAPEIETFTRKGFVAVEWGGILEHDSSTGTVK
jgi:hypothetical protein